MHVVQIVFGIDDNVFAMWHGGGGG
jgi:hypothetical protein